MLVAEALRLFLDLLVDYWNLFPDLTITSPLPGGWTMSIPGWVPLALLTQTLVVAVGVNVALIAYNLANWVWRHIPNIFGWGPGAG